MKLTPDDIGLIVSALKVSGEEQRIIAKKVKDKEWSQEYDKTASHTLDLASRILALYAEGKESYELVAE